MGQPANGVKLITAAGGTPGLLVDNRARPFPLTHRQRMLAALGLLALFVALMLLAVALVLAFFVLSGGGGPLPPAESSTQSAGLTATHSDRVVVAAPPAYPAPPTATLPSTTQTQTTPPSTTQTPTAPPPSTTSSTSTPPTTTSTSTESSPVPHTSSEPTSAPLRHFVLPPCPSAKLRPRKTRCEPVRSVDKVDVLSPAPPNEGNISTSLHWGGVAPVNYQLDFVVPDTELLADPNDRRQQFAFGGVIKMVLIVKGGEAPRHVFVHANATALKVHKVSLSRRCGGQAPCVKSVRQVQPQGDVLLIELDEALLSDVHYELTVEYTGRKVGFNTGLYLSRSPSYASASQRHAAISTLFQLRHARLVAPLMDHPALKATLDLCLTHPQGLEVLANGPKVTEDVGVCEDGKQLPVAGRVSPTSTLPCGQARTCFAGTPPLSTYLYSFALMRNYTVSQPIAAEGNRTIRIASPTADGSQYNWMLSEASDYVSDMQRATRMPLMTPKLDFVLAHTPFWGIENMGLVGVDKAYMKLREREQSHSILAHEVIHQWLGNVVTARAWDDVCLQEGLTTYLEWRLSAKAGRIALGSHVIRTHIEVMNREAKEPQPPIVRFFEDTQQIVDTCFKKPPLIFHMLRKTFGDDVIEHLLRTLVHRYKFAAAGLAEWQEILNEKSEEAGTALMRWFTEPGYALVIVTKLANPPNAIRLHQANAIGVHTFTESHERPFLFGLSAITSDGWQLPASATLLNGTDSVVARVVESSTPTPSTLNSWTLYNVDRSALARVIYDASTYTNLLTDCIDPERPLDWKPRCTALKSWHTLNYALHDLCWGVSASQIPAVDTESSDEWAALATLLVSYSDRSTGMLDLPGACRCCFMTAEQLAQKQAHPYMTDCGRAWHRVCKDTKLVQVLGTKFEGGSPPIRRY